MLILMDIEKNLLDNSTEDRNCLSECTDGQISLRTERLIKNNTKF